MKNSITQSYHTTEKSPWLILCLHLLAAVLLILAPILLARAQRIDAPLTVSSVSSHPSLNGTIVTIVADSSLNKAQTWQDRDGFHIVVPDAGLSDLVQSTKSIKVRRVGSSIEVLLQVKPGTVVQVQAVDKNLNLSFEGKFDSGQSDSDSTQGNQGANQSQSSTYSLPTYSASNLTTSAPAESTTTAASSASAAATSQTPAPKRQAAVRDTGESPSKDGTVTEVVPQDDGLLASVFSGTSVAIILVLAMVALFVVRKFRSKSVGSSDSDLMEVDPDEADSNDYVEPNADNVVTKEANVGMVRSNPSYAGNGASQDRKAVARQSVTVPASLYGAYRIDQEVGKLVLGQAHRMDVMQSRASEDRRAIQASLIKTIVSPDSSDDERRRAREALEEYGFVARESAALLFAPDAFDRTSAARSLGEIGSPVALPFLLEALYDVESIVRNQAVVSIGELKLPSSIGALLDMARKHPDVPSSLVSRALSACSVEGLNFFDAEMPNLLGSGFEEPGVFEFTHLEPASSVEELPEGEDDEALSAVLAKVSSEDHDERTDAIKALAQFPAKRSVQALVSIAQDSEASFRALAVTSLAFIDHESVFPAVLVGMADESREVRAAAARALSRLSFDRSAAYATVIETADFETLQNVAQACIKAGIVSQNIDRLASGDRRQAYEAFSLISLLAKAKMTDPIVYAIEHHNDKSVRLSAIHLLATTGEQHVFEQLQQLAVNEEMDEEVKTALLDGMYKLEQTQSQEAVPVPVEEFVVHESAEEIEPVETTPEEPVGFDFAVRTEADEFEL